MSDKKQQRIRMFLVKFKFGIVVTYSWFQGTLCNHKSVQKSLQVSCK